MKKLLFLLFATILPTMASAYDAYIDGIYYNLNGGTKEAEVTNRNGNPNSLFGRICNPTAVSIRIFYPQ